jgi:hypothetical protein
MSNVADAPEIDYKGGWPHLTDSQCSTAKLRSDLCEGQSIHSAALSSLRVLSVCSAQIAIIVCANVGTFLAAWILLRVVWKPPTPQEIKSVQL